MSKIVAFTYSFLILFQSLNISFEDISKFSALIEHAQYHKAIFGDSFFQFLDEHYGDSSIAHGHANTNDHEKLPFKHDHQRCQHLNSVFTINSNIFQFEEEEFMEIPFNYFYKETHSLFEKPSIFQPPKAV